MSCYRIIYCFLLISVPLRSLTGPPDSNVPREKASYYHNRFHGRETSNGETYDKDDFTAAHRTLPFNTLLLVTNKRNGKSVIVRVNDRGPFKRSRVIDLSYAAARKVGMVRYGVVPVKIDILHTLDRIPAKHPALRKENIWDCYGRPQPLTGYTVFIWRTDGWKHAFYMASKLTLETKMNILVKSEHTNNDWNYYLLLTGIQTEHKAGELSEQFRRNGFSHSRLYRAID
jgi:hypothetical protein